MCVCGEGVYRLWGTGPRVVFGVMMKGALLWFVGIRRGFLNRKRVGCVVLCVCNKARDCSACVNAVGECTW